MGERVLSGSSRVSSGSNLWNARTRRGRRFGQSVERISTLLDGLLCHLSLHLISFPLIRSLGILHQTKGKKIEESSTRAEFSYSTITWGGEGMDFSFFSTLNGSSSKCSNVNCACHPLGQISNCSFCKQMEEELVHVTQKKLKEKWLGFPTPRENWTQAHG